MKVVCCYCKKVIQEGDDSLISHSVCAECLPDVLAELQAEIDKIKEAKTTWKKK